MTEESDIRLGFGLVVLLCLIVIAMSSYKVAYCATSYFQDGKSALPFAGDRSDRFISAPEPPVFWNMGSVEETNELLQAAAAQKETNDEGYTPRPKHAEQYQGKPAFAKPTDFTHLESFAGVGL